MGWFQNIVNLGKMVKEASSFTQALLFLYMRASAINTKDERSKWQDAYYLMNPQSSSFSFDERSDLLQFMGELTPSETIPFTSNERGALQQIISEDNFWNNGEKSNPIVISAFIVMRRFNNENHGVITDKKIVNAILNGIGEGVKIFKNQYPSIAD